MKTCLSILAAWSVAFLANAASVGLAWNANTESDLAGYRLYQGTLSGTYSIVRDLGNVTATRPTNLEPGVTYFWIVTAYNTSGLESEPSNEVSYRVPVPLLPSPVAGIEATRTPTNTVLVWTPNDPTEFIARYIVSWLPLGSTNWGRLTTTNATATIDIGFRTPMAIAVQAEGPGGRGVATSLTLDGFRPVAQLRIVDGSLSYDFEP